MMKRALALAGITVMAAGAMTACTSSQGGKNEASQSDSGALKLVATTTQICDYATQIFGNEDSDLVLARTDSQGNTEYLGKKDTKDGSDPKADVELNCLLAPNASAHEHEMTPQQMEALGNADLFLVNGVDLEHFLDTSVESSGFHGKMVVTSGVRTATDITDPEKSKKEEAGLDYEVDKGSQHVDVQKWPFPPEEGESAESFVFDPHVWTTPENAEIQVANMAGAMEAAKPELADQIKARSEHYTSDLKALDDWARKSFESVPKENRVLFTSHDAFGYFSNEFGIDFIGAALSDFNGQQDATAEHIAQAAEQVKKSRAKALFAENSNNSKSVETIARAAGVRAIIGDDALYGDSLGPVGSDGETYIGSQLHNIINLVKAWGGTPAEIPAQLAEYKPENVID